MLSMAPLRPSQRIPLPFAPVSASPSPSPSPSVQRCFTASNAMALYQNAARIDSLLNGATIAL